MQHMMPGQPRVKENVMTSGKKVSLDISNTFQ